MRVTTQFDRKLGGANVFGIGTVYLRGPLFHALVRDEQQLFRDLHGAQAHAAVIAKLKRTDITTRYRRVLAEVEKRLRPSHIRLAVPRIHVGRAHRNDQQSGMTRGV